MQVSDPIYVRTSSASLMSDVVHEVVHAMDYLNGVDKILYHRGLVKPQRMVMNDYFR